MCLPPIPQTPSPRPRVSPLSRRLSGPPGWRLEAGKAHVPDRSPAWWPEARSTVTFVSTGLDAEAFDEGLLPKVTPRLCLLLGRSSLQTYFKVTDQLNERWQSDWILAAFWHVLAFVLLGSICVLWAPSQSSTRYARIPISEGPCSL